MRHLVSKPTLGKGDEEQLRLVLACPKLVSVSTTSSFWATVPEGVNMPTQWPVRELGTHSGALGLLVALVSAIMSDTGDRVVIAAYRKASLELIKETLRALGFHTKLLPSMSGKPRSAVLLEFAQPDSGLRVLLLRGLGDGTGLTLTAANRLVLFDPDWDPHNDDQMMARVWRTSQTKPCYIYRIVTCGCFDEYVLQRGLKKEALDQFIRSGGASGSAGAAAQGASVRARYVELLQCDLERPALPEDANNYKYYTAPGLARQPDTSRT